MAVLEADTGRRMERREGRGKKEGGGWGGGLYIATNPTHTFAQAGRARRDSTGL